MNRSRLAALSAGATFLVASVMAPATAMAAGTGSVSLSPANVSTSVGSTFFVDINTQASVAMSGASATIDFDKTMLQIVSVTKPALGTGWNQTGLNFVFPSVSTISTANVTGHLAAPISAYYNDGDASATPPVLGSSLPANTSEVLARVTFLATATGDPTISLPTSDLLDGSTVASYGSPVGTTGTGATVHITAGSGGSSNATTNVTGSVDAGYVSLTCPTATGVSIPLARGVNNVANFECQIGSNVTWTLNTLDTNSDPTTHGYMRDTTQVPAVHLHDSLFVHSNPHVVVGPGPGFVPTTVYDSDVNLAASASAQALATGQNNINLPLTFTQFAEPNDVAGNYSAQILFSIVSTF